MLVLVKALAGKGEAVAGKKHIFAKGMMIKSEKERPLQPDKVIEHSTPTSPSGSPSDMFSCKRMPGSSWSKHANSV